MPITSWQVGVFWSFYVLNALLFCLFKQKNIPHSISRITLFIIIIVLLVLMKKILQNIDLKLLAHLCLHSKLILHKHLSLDPFVKGANQE